MVPAHCADPPHEVRNSFRQNSIGTNIYIFAMISMTPGYQLGNRFCFSLLEVFTSTPLTASYCRPTSTLTQLDTTGFA